MKSGQHASVGGLRFHEARFWAFRALRAVPLSALVAALPSCSGGTSSATGSDSGVGSGRDGASHVGVDAKSGVDARNAVDAKSAVDAHLAPPSSCTDGIKNGEETDVDCGGSACPACAVGQGCDVGKDCVTQVCTGDKCQAPTSSDGVLNDSETDVDCGGALLASGQPNPSSDGASPCGSGQTCRIGSDCASSVCASGAAHGGSLDAGVDAAGADAGAPLTCQPPTDHDGVLNDSETDVDCGGGRLANGDTNTASDGAPGCTTGKACVLGSDCGSKVCTSKKCVAATDSDGVENDSETDVDCGGGFLASGAKNTASDGASPCADDKKCLLDTDCASAFCSQISHTCVDGQSCKGLVTPAKIMDVTTPASTTLGGADAIGTPDPNGVGQSAGLDTCGPGESTDPIGQQRHESCCKSLPITINGTSERYDKYEVTAGRMRQFLEAVSYDVRSWALAQFNAQFVPMTTAGKTLLQELAVNQTGVTTNMLELLPSTNDPSVPLNAVIQTGALVMDTAGLQGCYTGVGEFGAATYFWDSHTLDDQASSPPRPFTQDYYDIKSMNCIPYWLGAAFCAWDGGRLPLETEHKLVWDGGASGTNTYPWGGADFLPNPYPGNTELSEPQYQPAVQFTVDWKNSNLGMSTGQGNFYFYPSTPLTDPLGAPASLTSGLDLTPYTAAPGRFALDKTSLTVNGEGWQDLGANMIEMAELTTYTGTASFCDASGQLGTGEAFNCNCPSNNCSNTSCGGSGAHCGITRGTDMPTYAILGGSWEGHAVDETLSASYVIYRQYGKLGIRCMRPAE